MTIRTAASVAAAIIFSTGSVNAEVARNVPVVYSSRSSVSFEVSWKWTVGKKLGSGCVVVGAQHITTPTIPTIGISQPILNYDRKFEETSSIQDTPMLKHILPKIFRCDRK